MHHIIMLKDYSFNTRTGVTSAFYNLAGMRLSGQGFLYCLWMLNVRFENIYSSQHCLKLFYVHGVLNF
jgi:hypothetical protein